MRNVIQLEQNFGSVPIESIEFDANSRDDIPAVLKGLQLIWSDKEKREALFSLLETYFLPGTDLGVGRPGMNMWRILVLSVLKQSLGCDFDRLQELANKHSSVRRMMGHGDAVFDGTRYERRTIAGNVSLLAPELLNDVNGLIVAAGHEVSKRKPGESLAARCDSFVVETNVHFPTDVNLLWDATRALLRETQRACAEFGIGGWRQRQHLEEKARKLFRKVGTASRWKKRPKEVAAYIEFCGRLADRAEASLAELGTAGAGEVDASMILRFLEHARRQIDQIDRRLLKGETIPHAEKVFSVFEEHTRWISKGKAGTPVELGVPVAIVEDQFQFILGHSILWKGGDVDVAIPIVENCRERHPDLRVCSFDRGFHSPAEPGLARRAARNGGSAEEGASEQGRHCAGIGSGVRSGPASSSGRGIGDQQSGETRSRPGSDQGRGRVRENGGPVHPRGEPAPDRSSAAARGAPSSREIAKTAAQSRLSLARRSKLSKNPLKPNTSPRRSGGARPENTGNRTEKGKNRRGTVGCS